MRTPNEALRTLTARLVDDHFTYGIVSTGSSKAAWVSTLASDTRQAAWAVKVRLAFSFFFGGALHQWVAVGLSRGALAEGGGAFNDAEGVKSTTSISARVDGRTTTQAPREWVPGATSLAFAVISSNKVLTYRISSTWVSKTFVLVRSAFNTGVAHIIWRTSTLLPMSDALALGVDTTGVGKEAEVDTGTILAALGSLAVLVPHTFHFAAFSLWISLQTLRAEADRSMVGHPALSCGGTTSSGTGILTLTGHTSLFAVAVVVFGTAWETGAPFA